VDSVDGFPGKKKEDDSGISDDDSAGSSLFVADGGAEAAKGYTPRGPREQGKNRKRTGTAEEQSDLTDRERCGVRNDEGGVEQLTPVG